MSDETPNGDYLLVSERCRQHAEDNGWRFYERESYGHKRAGWHRYDAKGGWSLRTGPGGAEDIMKMLDHDDRCGECGAWIEYNSAIEERLRTEQRCATCDFYLRHIAKLGDLDVIVQRGDNGERWGYKIGTVGHSSRPSSSLGIAGRKFTVRFFDGRVVETNDLWCWGTGIPEHFHDRLPVNAEFVQQARSYP